MFSRNLRAFNKINRKILTQHINRTFSASATTFSSLTETKPNPGIVNQREKKPKLSPLVKNFFVGAVEKEFLAFPEVLTEDELKTVYSGSSLVDTKTTEVVFINEHEATSLNYSHFKSGHLQVIQLIEEFGSEAQKTKYLPTLLSNLLDGVSPFFEPSSSGEEQNKSFNVRAKYNDSNDTWMINGEKAYVLLKDVKTSLMLVVTSIESTDHIGDLTESIKVFLVNGDDPSVTVTGSDTTLGFIEDEDYKQVRVSFNNTIVQAENILGAADDGVRIGLKLLKLMRFDAGSLALGVSKETLKHFIEHNINNKLQGAQLRDIDLIKKRVGEMSCDVYALESMLYMTAGLRDIYDDQDTDLESAIIKAFANEVLSNSASAPLKTIGTKATIKGDEMERLVRSAIHLNTIGETGDAVKMYIGLMGLQHAGMSIHEDIKKSRNPLENPGFIFSKFFKPSPIDNPKQVLNLQYNLHPSLDPAAQWLEFSIIRLQAATEILLGRYGPQVIDYRIEVARLSDMATLCYGMFASVARASRSYCIGLRNSDYEMLLASAICLSASDRVKAIAIDITKGEFICNDNNYKKIGKKVMESKSYFPVSPVTRNF
ncbi:unnamed protein product [Diamesa serratosioi]